MVSKSLEIELLSTCLGGHHAVQRARLWRKDNIGAKMSSPMTSLQPLPGA